MKMKDIHIERKTSQEKEDGRNKQRREPLYQSKKELGTSAIRHNIFFHCVGLVSKKAGLTSQGLIPIVHFCQKPPICHNYCSCLYLSCLCPLYLDSAASNIIHIYTYMFSYTYAYHIHTPCLSFSPVGHCLFATVVGVVLVALVVVVVVVVVIVTVTCQRILRFFDTTWI